ncbi:MAG: hypothetical protein JEZ08_01510 [Clostridiales bacterium]|nr:hypothetical protein [Clostridiales bacterium]
MKKLGVMCICILMIGCSNDKMVAKDLHNDHEVIESVNEVDVPLEHIISNLEMVSQQKLHHDRIWTSDSNSDFVAVGSKDGSISLWSHDGLLIHHKLIHSKRVEEVELRSAIYSIGDDNKLYKTDYETFETQLLYEGVTKEFSINKDETLIGISSGDAVKVFDLTDFKELYSFDWHEGCFDLRFSPDSNHIYKVGHDGTVEKYEIKTGDVLKVYEGLNFDVHCLEVSKDGRYIVAGATDQNVAIWDESGELIKKYRHLDGLYDVAISLDQKYVASVGVDGNVFLVSLETGDYIKRIPVATELHTVSFTSEGLVTGGYDYDVYFASTVDFNPNQKITVDNLEDLTLLKEIKAHNQSAFDLAISHDNKYIATSSFDNKLRIWDIKTSQLLHDVQMEELGVTMKFTLDGQKLIYKGEKGNLVIYNLITRSTEYASKDKGLEIGTFALSEDNKYLAVGDEFGKLTLMDFETMEVLRTYQGLDHWIFQIEYSKDMKKVFFAYAGDTKDFSTTALDFESFEKLYQTEGHEGYNYDIKVTSDYVITAGADHMIKIWDMGSGRLVRTLDKHYGKVMEVDLPLDESWLVSGSAHDKTMRLWHVTGELIKTIKPETEVQCVQLSEDETFVASIGIDGVIRLYGVRDE